MKIVLNKQESQIVEWLINISLNKLTNSHTCLTCANILDKIYSAIPDNMENQPWSKTVLKLKEDVYAQLKKG